MPKEKEKIYNFPEDTPKLKTDCLGKSGVYMIRNKLNGHIYIGSALSKTARSNRIYIGYRNHFYNSHKATNVRLRRAMVKYGKHNFEFIIIKWADATEVRKEEQKEIEKRKPEYNILTVVEDNVSYKHSEEVKTVYSEKRKEQIGALNRGKNLSIETRERISESRKGKHREVSEKFKKSRARKTGTWDAKTGKQIKEYESAKDLWRDYRGKIDYRTIRRHIKSGEPIRKLGIVVRYIL